MDITPKELKIYALMSSATSGKTEKTIAGGVRKGKGKDKAGLSNFAGRDVSRLTGNEVKKMLSPIVSLVDSNTPLETSPDTVDDVYDRLDALQKQGDKDAFRKLVVETVAKTGFIQPESKPQYEHDIEYAMPFYFLTGLRSLLSFSCYFSKFLAAPESCIVPEFVRINYPKEFNNWHKPASIAALSILQLNLLCLNKDNVRVYILENKEGTLDIINNLTCLNFKRDQYPEIVKILETLSQYAHLISQTNNKAVRELLPAARECAYVLYSCEDQVQISREDFLALVKDTILSSENPFSMSGLGDALPVLTDPSAMEMATD